MAGSLVAAVKLALVELLQTDVDLEGVQVTYGWPGDDLAEHERIFTGRATAEHEPASLKAGRTFRTETVEFEVLVQVEAVGGTQHDADERALYLGQQFEECVADHRTLGGVAGLNWTVVAGHSLDNGYNDQGYLTQLTYTVRYNARLT